MSDYFFQQLSRGACFGKKSKPPVAVAAEPTPTPIREEPNFFSEKSSQIKAPKQSKPAAQPLHDLAPMSTEEVGRLRKQQRLRLTGTDAPPPLRSFEEIGPQLPRWLARTLAAHGFATPTPIQMQTLPCLLAGRELLAIAPTGSGKTAAFLIPMLARLRTHGGEGVRGLVLVPTRELAQQIHRVARSFIAGSGLHVNLLSRASLGAIAADPTKSDILISTPISAGHLLKQRPECFRRLEFLVFDEADKLFESGFLSQIDAVVAAAPPHGVVRALFCATLPSTVEELARSVLIDPLRVTVGARGTATSLVAQRLVYAGSEEGKVLALRNLLMGDEALLPPIVVFVQSKDRAEELLGVVRHEGIPAASLHAGLSRAQRESAVQSLRTGAIWVLVATDLFARGMDVRSINAVVNYDFPQSADAYVHRVGRAGRRRAGTAVTLFTEEDAPALRTVAVAIREAGGEIPEWMIRLPKVSKRVRTKLRARPPQRESITEASHMGTPSRRSEQGQRKRARADPDDSGASDSESG